MGKIEDYLAKCDERREKCELEIAEILETRAQERELRRANLAKMRSVDTMVSKCKMPFVPATTAQTKMDRESIHDAAQSNATLLRILRKMGR